MCEHMNRLTLSQFRLTDVLRDFYCLECGYELIIGLPVKIVYWTVQMILQTAIFVLSMYHPNALLLYFPLIAEAYFLGYGAYLYVYRREGRDRMNQEK